MKSVFQKPIFWILFTVFSIIAAIFTFNYFSQTFPIVHINLTMNRFQANKKANEIAKKFRLGPTNAYLAESFQIDDTVKTYVELEAGGKQAFIKMMENNLYHPYTWKVRLFKEYSPNEALIIFTPEGTPYGFFETISENEPGAELSEQSAQALAVAQAEKFWNINFTKYTLVDSSKQIQPSNRIDYSFVYERKNEKIGDGLYRLTLGVSGNKLSALYHSIKLPESFFLSYNEMRSTNETLSYLSLIFMLLFYLIGGCIIGLFFMFRMQWVLWYPAAIAAGLLSSLSIIESLNQFPLIWLSYNTATSQLVFLTSYFISIIVNFLFKFPSGFFSLLLIIMACESLGRYAFGHQIQFWKIWKPSTASSYAVLGRTISSYLLIPFELMYIILFYFITTHYFNWWVPSQSLFNPNILATYVPWLSTSIMALYTAFWEECFFRAIPIACGAIIGEKYGNKKWWIVVALLIQALIFGAAHAGYPMQPAYARIMELFFSSFILGLIYLRFGLYTAIVYHFIFDLIFMSLPLFISSASGAWVNQTCVIVIAFIPILIILYAFIKTGRFQKLSSSALNNAWKPEKKKSITQKEKSASKIISLKPRTLKISLICGILGLGLWLFTFQRDDDGKELTLSREQAIKLTLLSLKNKQINIEKPWIPLTKLFSHYKDSSFKKAQHKFIWQKGGKKLYSKLLSSYLSAPYWHVRLINFDVPIVERAREYHGYVASQGLLGTKLQIPEAEAGKQISENEARKIALQAVTKTFKLNLNDISEISAISTKKPNRLDWMFVFSDKNYPLKEGQARTVVKIAGSTLVNTYQYIHVPEDWKRTEKNRNLITKNINNLIGMVIYFVFLLGLVSALFQLNKKNLNLKTLLTCSAIFIFLYLFDVLNSWPRILSTFNTSQPFIDQVIRNFGLSIIWAVIKGVIFAFIFVFINNVYTKYRFSKRSNAFVLGTALGLIAAGLLMALYKLVPSIEPLWAIYNPLDNLFIIPDGIIGNVLHFMTLTLLLLLYLLIINFLTNNWKNNRCIASVLMILYGILIIGINSSEHIVLWLSSGITLGIFFIISYITVVRFDLRTVLAASGCFYMLHIIQQGFFNVYPGAITVAMISIVIISMIIYYWSTALEH